MTNKTSRHDNFWEVIIIGGGAAGLFCAATAAARGKNVLVLESATKIGKKILMSGGGRCNFTNRKVEPEHFSSNNIHFCKSALSQYTENDFISLVERNDLEYEERKNGQLFCKHAARDIVTLLENECTKHSVTIRTSAKVKSATRNPSDFYTVELSRNDKTTESLTCSSLVVASGGLSVPTLGGSDIGYVIARAFGLPITDVSAGLVPFMFSDEILSLCKSLTGCSAPVDASCNGMNFTEDMLFTHRGISGPAILQISSYWVPGDAVMINLMPWHNAPSYLLDIKNESPKSLLRTVLANDMPRALVIALEALWWPNQSESPLANWENSKLKNIGALLNGWTVKPSSTEGYRTAEVTLGGINTDTIKSKSMECKDFPNLFFIGEVLDVTGHLGGFNFQWAWSSGYVAGLSV
jgi:hypothetical protein